MGKLVSSWLYWRPHLAGGEEHCLAPHPTGDTKQRSACFGDDARRLVRQDPETAARPCTKPAIATIPVSLRPPTVKKQCHINGMKMPMDIATQAADALPTLKSASAP